MAGESSRSIATSLNQRGSLQRRWPVGATVAWTYPQVWPDRRNGVSTRARSSRRESGQRSSRQRSRRAAPGDADRRDSPHEPKRPPLPAAATVALRPLRADARLPPDRRRTRRYVLQRGQDSAAAGRISVRAQPLEDVVEAVLYRLDSPDLADALAGALAPDVERVRIEVEEARAQLAELAQDYYGERAITRGGSPQPAPR